jgi:hypothetical protein
VTSVDQIQAIGIRVLHVAEEVASASRDHGRSDRIIEQRGTGGAGPYVRRYEATSDLLSF